MTDGLTDGELVTRLRSGSSDALGELFDRHADRIYTYCFRRTASWAVAEDATSTVFLEAWRSRERAAVYDEAALPWLFGIATNVCRNLTRSQRRHQAALGRLPRPAPGPDHADDVGDRVDSERTMARIAAAMANLSERDREVVALVVWSGLSYEEAAAALGVPVGTVR
ncbi:MAG: RNA polymerase sigma factor, partial [Nocardioides sp.]